MQNINKLIDHTILKAMATEEDVRRICQEALDYDFASVCINPCYVSLAHELLKGSNVKVCTVIGFPLGANTVAVKKFETEDAVNNGAEEIDMVINVGKAKEHNFDFIRDEISEVVASAKGNLVKVILETCYLTDEEITACCKAASLAKADFVKTSTGFGTGGATVHHVEIMRNSIPNDMSVKASGGVRNLSDLEAMVKAGASRIGASSGVQIMEGLKGGNQ